ncbi:MAG: hypothetical protein KGY74_10685 [Candidatus Cloacimonetes bacterium]|nr:hypothetical protein [Candidatus Cloacimonadota bacterium]
MKKLYILITETDIYYSKMFTPLARIAGVDRRTIKRWVDNPTLSQKKGFVVRSAIKAQDYKAN